MAKKGIKNLYVYIFLNIAFYNYIRLDCEENLSEIL